MTCALRAILTAFIFSAVASAASALTIDFEEFSHGQIIRDSQGVAIRTTIQNNARDHIIRALFPAGITSTVSHVEGHFDIVERPHSSHDVNSIFKDAPQGCFIDINDGDAGLAIANRGLPAYQIRQDHETTIALTLLRCVGFLGRNGISHRQISLYPLEAPQAQCLGVHHFEYSIMPHHGTLEDSAVYQQAFQYQTKLITAQTTKHSGSLPAQMSLVTIEPKELIVSAIKKHESNDTLVIRLYNIANKSVAGTLRCFKNIHTANLLNMNEEIVGTIQPTSPDALPLDVQPKKIITLELLLGD